MVLPNDQKGTDGQGDQKIKVDDKEYSVDDVKNLLTGAAAATQKSQQTQGFMDAAQAYGVKPEELLEQSIGALNLLGSLVEKGIIDQEGNLVEKKVLPKSDADDLARMLNLKKKGDDKLEFDGASKAILEGLTALRTEVGSYKTQIEDLRSVQTGIIRESWSGKIRGTYPNLSDRDVSEVFGTAIDLRKAGKKADLLEVAKVISEAKAGETSNVVKDWATKHGIDYEKITAGTDENSLREQIAKGGAGVIAGGKKIVLFGTAKEGEINASDAAQAYLKSQLEQ